MLVGDKCFADPEIVGFIQSEGVQDTCDFSQTSNCVVIDIVELTDFFLELLENIKENENGRPLIDLVQNDWNLFSNTQIGSEIIDYILIKSELVLENANTLVSYNDEIIDAITYWDVLKESLKWKSRYITDIEKLVELKWDSFFNTQFKLSRGRVLFRARVHHEAGKEAFKPEGLKSPPSKVTSSGRANPSGIPHLYLCDNAKTVLYEVRASYLDELSIGKFKATRPLRIVDFTEKTSIYNPGAVNDTIKAHLLRKYISRDLSKPMRRYDSELEYIPTQFICEYIRVNTGADGIQFQSSLHPKGKNIVVFDDDLVDCFDVSLVKVDKTMLHSHKI